MKILNWKMITMTEKIIKPLTPQGKLLIQRFWIEEPNELVACLKDYDEGILHFTKENGEINEQIITIMDKLNDLNKGLETERQINKRLTEENHRLRLALIHQDDITQDIKWLKKTLKSKTEILDLIDKKIEDVSPFDKGLCRRILTELKMEIKGEIL